MDKYVFKCILKQNNIPVLDCKYYDLNKYNEDLESIIEEVEKVFSYPVIIKPANLGSSIGIQIAKGAQELEEAIENAFNYSKKIIIEKAITNLKEVNCSVLGDYEETKASECEEPIKTDDILSFNDKYISGGEKCSIKINEKTMNSGRLKLPADIDEKTKNTIQELSIKTFKALGCCGVARIDVIIDIDTNKIYVNEINTIPGCLSFHLWKATKMNYKNLLDRLIELSLKRNREDKNIINSFDSNILSECSLKGSKCLKINK